MKADDQEPLEERPGGLEPGEPAETGPIEDEAAGLEDELEAEDEGEEEEDDGEEEGEEEDEE